MTAGGHRSNRQYIETKGEKSIEHSISFTVFIQQKNRRYFLEKHLVAAVSCTTRCNDKDQEYKRQRRCKKYSSHGVYVSERSRFAGTGQLHLEKAYKNFPDPKVGFHVSSQNITLKTAIQTNVVNGNILVEGSRIRLPKLNRSP